MKMKKLAPSVLSILRIVLALALFYVYINGMMELSIVIYIVTLFTDYLDGFIARKLDAATNYGAYLDTVADFILITVLFSAFIITGMYPYWILILIVFMFLQFVLTSGIKKPIYDPIGKYYGAFLFISAGITFVLPISYINQILTVLIVLFSFLSLFTRYYSLYKKD